MENIIAKASSLYDALLERSKVIGEQADNLTKLEKDLGEKDTKLTTWESDLTAREAEVKKVEDLQALVTIGNNIKNKNLVESTKIRGEQNKLDEKEKAVKLEMQTKKNELTEQKALCDKNWKALRESEALHREEIKNYKDKVLEQLKAGIS